LRKPLLNHLQRFDYVNLPIEEQADIGLEVTNLSHFRYEFVTQVALWRERHAANLPAEIVEVAADDASMGDTAARKVIWKERNCARWCAYEQGLSPLDHLSELKSRALEDDRRAFQLQLNEFETHQAERERHADRRLTKASIWFASIIGVVQLVAALLTMTKDSVGYPVWQLLVGFASWLRGLLAG